MITNKTLLDFLETNTKLRTVRKPTWIEVVLRSPSYPKTVAERLIPLNPSFRNCRCLYFDETACPFNTFKNEV